MRETMRVLVYGDIGGSGGYLRYCRGLFAGGHVPDDIEMLFVCSSSFAEKTGPFDERVNVYAHPWPESPSRLHRALWHTSLYPAIAGRWRPDVEMYPTGRIRAFMRNPVAVAVCQNLLVFDDAEMARYRGTDQYETLMGYRAAQVESYRRASAMIFTSSWSEQVVSRFAAGWRRSAIVPLAADSCFREPVDRSYRLGDTVKVLYVSPVFYYKHQVEVVDALKAVRERTGLDLRLRLVGGGEESPLSELRAHIRAVGAESWVELVGHCDTEQVLAEYRSADLFVFASACESFGITVLEAAGMGLPIACSDASGLPDLLGDSAVYFDPRDPASLVSALLQLLASEDTRRRLGETARSRALTYTWRRCADGTFDLLREVRARERQGTSPATAERVPDVL